MSIITSTVVGGAEFAYTSAFADTGSRWSKVQINTVAFYTSGAITSWTLSLKDEAGNTVATILNSTTTATFYTTEVGQLPVTDDGQSYQLAFVTTGLATDARLTIDWQIAKTGAT